jgi:hypothetical protein
MGTVVISIVVVVISIVVVIIVRGSSIQLVISMTVTSEFH